MLAACGGEPPAAPTAASVSAPLLVAADASELTVTGLRKVGETRVGRSVIDYAFEVTFRNSGNKPLSAIRARLTAVGAGATIIDASIAFDAIGAGASVTPPDTITIRQDRSVPFNPTALAWDISASETPPAVPGILLPGMPGSLAVNAIPRYRAVRTASDLAIAIDEKGRRYYRSQLQAVINDGATVEQVNSALLASGARLVWSMFRNPVVSLQVPEPASIAALRQMADALEATPAFDMVNVVLLPQISALPGNVTPDDAVDSLGPILNHIGARVYAAWNTAAALDPNAEVQLVITDYFGQGLPGGLGAFTLGAFNVDALDCVPPFDKNINPCEHGYHVLGILAGSYGGNSDAFGQVTGVLPKAMKVSVIDMTVQSGAVPVQSWEDVRERLEEQIRATPERKFVVNFSLGYYCPTDEGCTSEAEAREDAIAWRQWARRIDLGAGTGLFDWDNKVFLVSAAGNEFGFDARRASPVNAAALLPTYIQEGKSYPPLSNSLVVEARETQNFTPLPVPIAACQPVGFYSNIQGDIAGIGGGDNEVFSFIGPSATGRKTGTSMAAPQVAGLVAWMISVRPQWALSLIKYRIQNVRVRDDCPGQTPMVDAYAAMLALDRSIDDAPVRTALLKQRADMVRAGDQFDYADALAFLTRFFPERYNMPVRVDLPDFSRYDLNGDGYTGGPRKAPFDVQFNGVNAPFNPTSVTAYPYNAVRLDTPIDESQVSDFEILCYYVHSPLMTEFDRGLFNGELVTRSAMFPNLPQISCSDRAVALRVNATHPNWNGLPATIILRNFVRPFPATTAGNSATCTNQGALPGERGSPLFSREVPTPLPIYAALDVTGMPSPLNGGTVNRRNCSSFFATNGTQAWINATGRAVFGFGGSVVSDWEYQVRYTNGGPNGEGKKCSIGTVANANGFFATVEDPSCTHQETLVGNIRQ